MKKLSSVVVSRRQLIALALGSTAAFGLAACGGGDSAEQSQPADVPAAESMTEDELAAAQKQIETAQLNTDAFDAIIANGVTASEDEIMANAWASKVKDVGKLRVGTTRTSTLFSLESTDKSMVFGFDVGLYRLLAKYVLDDQTSVDIVQVNSSTRESMLQSDQVDAVFAAYPITDDRKQLVSFAGPYYESHLGVLVTASNTEINSVADLNNKTVGVWKSANALDALREVAPQATVREMDSDEELLSALGQKQIDAYVSDATILFGDMVKFAGVYRFVAEFGPAIPYGVGLPLDSDGVAFVNNFLRSLEENGTWESLWSVCIGDRVGIATPPVPPVIV